MATRSSKRVVPKPDDMGLEGAQLGRRQKGTDQQRLSGKSLKQSLKFVDVTKRYVQGAQDAAEQKAIRVYVMQDYLRQKREPAGSIALPIMTGTVSDHVNRFRIVKESAARPKPGRPGQSKYDLSSSELIHHKGRPGQHSIPVSGSRNSSSMTDAKPWSDGWEVNLDSLSAEGPSPLSLKVSGSTGRMDPFSRLPIESSMETHGMLDYYRTSFWMNSLAVNPDGKWLSIAITDPATLHATLSLVAQHRSISQGLPASQLYYMHRGAAIQIITSRITNVEEATSDATIGAVALLSSSDNYFHLPSEIRHSHISGLASLVQLRGGIQALSCNEPVKRVVTWADLVHATSHDRSPCFGISKCNAGYDLEPLFPRHDVSGGLLRTAYPYEPCVPSPLVPVFETIRMLCMAQFSSYAVDLENIDNRRVYGNVLYKVEYLLVDPLLLSFQDADDEERSRLVREPMFLATTAGALIFTYSCLRDLAIATTPYGNLVSRLRGNLELILQETVEVMGRPSHGNEVAHRTGVSEQVSTFNRYPELVLWLLNIGFRATSEGHRQDDRSWFVAQASDLCRAIDVQSRSEFGRRMKAVVVFNRYCAPATDRFWKAILAYRHEGWSAKDGEELEGEE